MSKIEEGNNVRVSKGRIDYRRVAPGRKAVWQARLILLVMINIAQLWILSATIEAALAADYRQLIPLIVASGVCWFIALTIFLWWKPAKLRQRPKKFADRR